MNKSIPALWVLGVIILSVCCTFGQHQSQDSYLNWKDVVQSRLHLYGHRNWIVVADSAFPVYADPGIETISADDDLPTVLHYVAAAISSSHHVRATVFLDRELQFVDDHDYPGASDLKHLILSSFTAEQVSSLPHAEILSKLDEAGKTFRILFIKTSATIPYTSVFMRLDCGYMSNDVDRKIKAGVAKASRDRSR